MSPKAVLGEVVPRNVGVFQLAQVQPSPTVRSLSHPLCKQTGAHGLGRKERGAGRSREEASVAGKEGDAVEGLARRNHRV